jgi:hypothetical protein
MASKLKRPSTEWEKIFTSYTSDKGLITWIYRELKRANNLNIHQTKDNNQLYIRQRTDNLNIQGTQWANLKMGNWT